MGEVLRDYDQDFNELSTKLVSTLVKYFGANQGGLFVLEEGEDPQHLDLVAFYAYERNKYTDRKVKLGQGLVGQVFRSGKVLHLREIPEGYITVTSGLGHAPPDSLVLVPLILNEVTYGVIEMASFLEFEAYQIDLLAKLAENIASSLANLRNTSYTRKLLQESQELAEMMQSQEEEMRQNMEELQATQEEMSRKERQRESEIVEIKTDYEETVASLEKATQDLKGEVQALTEQSEKERSEKHELTAEIDALKEQLRSNS